MSKRRERREAAKANDREERRREHLRRWPLRAPSAKTRVIEPTVEVDTQFAIPAVEMIDGVANEHSLRERFRALIDHHPCEEIRVDMNKEILEGRLGIVLSLSTASQGYQAAVFRVLTQSDAKFARTAKLDGGFYPIIQIPWQALATNLDEAEIVRWWLIILHEYQHYLQYQTSSSKGRRRFVGLGLRRRDGAAHIRDEIAAYEREFEVALSWMAKLPESLTHLEEYIFTPEFPQYLFHIEMKYLAQQGLVSRKVVAGMAEAAGHPCPDAYL